MTTQSMNDPITRRRRAFLAMERYRAASLLALSTFMAPAKQLTNEAIVRGQRVLLALDGFRAASLLALSTSMALTKKLINEAIARGHRVLLVLERIGALISSLVALATFLAVAWHVVGLAFGAH